MPQEITAEDAQIFWEVVELMQTHCAFQSEEGVSIMQILEALSKHKELWIRDWMSKLLSKDDLMNLCELLSHQS